MQTATHGLSDDAHSLSQSAVGKVSGLFKSGKRRRAGEAAEGGAEASTVYAGATESLFNGEQTDWLADVVGESISHSLSEFGKCFGQRIEQRFIAAEKRIEALELFVVMLQCLK